MTTETTTPAESPRRMRVRVWFGSHVITEHTADPERAKRYAALLAQRFAGLRVTIDDQTTGATDSELPDEQWWDRTPL